VTERHRGFGIVTMLTLEQANALQKLNGRVVDGSKLVVDIAS
jgi:RNA recognition motif-containing protein